MLMIYCMPLALNCYKVRKLLSLLQVPYVSAVMATWGWRLTG